MSARTWIVGLLAALALTAPAQFAAAQTQPRPAVVQVDPRRSSMNGRVFDAVWSRVKADYYDGTFNGQDWSALGAAYRPLALQALDDNGLYRVINEMLDRLNDAHVSAQTPLLARYEARRNEPRPLLGLQIQRDADRFVLEDVKPGSPAEQAEIEFGWEVRSFDGLPYVPGRQLAAGVPVNVEFRDTGGAVRTVQITPVLMAAPVRREVRWLEPGVLLISFDEFNFGTTSWLNRQLANIPDGSRVVLDLRGNRGGLVMEARSVLGCFLPKGRVWARYHGRGGQDRSLTVSRGCRAFDGPLAVIVSGSSRSAAELVPGALQEANRATIVGRRTAGAVLISIESRLPDGGRFNMSVEDVRLANGVRLEHHGVSPDVEAYTTLADRRRGRDPALEAALAAVKATPVDRVGG